MDFIKENLFFVMMGVIVLLSLVAFGVVVHPMQVKNVRGKQKVENLEKRLSDYLRDSKLEGRAKHKLMPTKAAIVEAETYKKDYEEQLDRLQRQLSRMVLSAKLPDVTDKAFGDALSFKNGYQRAVVSLKGLLRSAGINDDGDGTWNFWDWGTKTPNDPQEKIRAAKEYNLTRELIDILILPALKVKRVDYIEVNPGVPRAGSVGGGGFTVTGRRTATKRLEPYFDRIPFVFEVRMPVSTHERLLEKLLKRDGVPFIVRTLSMGRLEESGAYRRASSVIISVRVTGWALDYNLVEEEEKLTSTKKRPRS